MPADIDSARLASLVELWEAFAQHPLERRIVEYVRAVRARGDQAAYARPAHYFAAAQAGASVTAAEYVLELDRGVRSFVLHTIESPDTAHDVTVSKIQIAGANHVDADVLMEGFVTNESDLDESRQLPHPLVIDVAGRITIDCTGSALNTSGLQMRGYHVDDVTARVVMEAGELWVEGLTQSPAAAAVQATNTPRTMRIAKRQTHLLARETLTGDAVRANVSILVKGDRLMPRELAVIPPRSPVKGGALLDVDWVSNDTLVLDTRYTSAGSAGTAKLSLTFMGRRKFLGAA